MRLLLRLRKLEVTRASLLEASYEIGTEPLWPIASTTQAEIEHHASSGATVLPEVRLVVLTSTLGCLAGVWL